MIESPHNEKLKEIRKLQDKKHRQRSGLFVAEGEDLVQTALDHGWESAGIYVTVDAPRSLTDLSQVTFVDAEALRSVSSLGSGTRVIGVFKQRWSQPGGRLSTYLDGVGDPGNVGTLLRSQLAFADGPVVLGPDCADPFSPKAVRASMGALFMRPPAQAELSELEGETLALDAQAPRELGDVDVSPPVVVCVGAEREGLSLRAVQGAALTARIAMRPDGPESVNAAVAASIALYELSRRFGTALGE